jgi:predicted small integral membrane protein
MAVVCDHSRYPAVVVRAAKIVLTVVVPVAMFINFSFALLVCSNTAVSFERNQLDTPFFRNMATAVAATTVLSAGYHTIVLQESLGDSHFWVAAIVYLGILIDRGRWEYISLWPNPAA